MSARLRPSAPSRGWARILAAASALVLVAVGIGVGLTALRRWAPPPGPAAAASAGSAAGVPAPGQAGTADCADPRSGTQWRVGWRADQGGPGTTVTATGFASRRWPVGSGPDGGWTSRDGETWALRWTSRRSSGLATVQERPGTLAALAAVPVSVSDSPRFVSPDGGCSVVAVPFANGVPGWPRVAVIGDSLVGQLDSAEDVDRWRTGLMQRRLLEMSLRAEVDGQPGRRWTALPPETTGPAAADLVMTDEIRGLRGADVQVVALGTNDAVWVALAPDDEQVALRMEWVRSRLAEVIDEILDAGPCTVLVTPGDGPRSYAGASPARFAEASRRVGDYLRERAGESDADGLHLSDWARASAGHRTGAGDPWFGGDTIHLNDAGRTAYADHLARAPRLCRS